MTDAKPFLKWVGGKRQLLPQLLPHIHAIGAPLGTWSGSYIEPFVGGGAVLFALSALPGFSALVNDYNPELVNLYRVVQRAPAELAQRLADPEFANTPAAHAAVRAWDKASDWPSRPAMDHAARFVYLNRTSFNGLWRVNRSGHFNVPYGRYKNPGFPSLDALNAASQALSRVEIVQGDFAVAAARAEPGDVVYFDPPYIPVSPSSSFVGYTDRGFDVGMQERLASVCDGLTARNIAWVLSNADVPLARSLFGRQPGVTIHRVLARRSVNRNAAGRGPVGEIIAVFAPRR